MRLVGASNLYIQLPFILEGAIAGLIGGLFAAILLVGSKIVLIDQLQESGGAVNTERILALWLQKKALLERIEGLK